MRRIDTKIDKSVSKILFPGKLIICKQRQGTNLVYKTRNYEPSILLINLRLTLKFDLIIRNAFLKHC